MKRDCEIRTLSFCQTVPASYVADHARDLGAAMPSHQPQMPSQRLTGSLMPQGLAAAPPCDQEPHGTLRSDRDHCRGMPSHARLLPEPTHRACSLLLAHRCCIRSTVPAHRRHSGLSTNAQGTSDTKFADYVPKTAFLFPGQGAQTVGMAKVCSHASDLLAAPGLSLCGVGGLRV